MIIHISKSVLFTKDPDRRFSDEYGLPSGLWNLMYNRYKLLEYTIPELCELYTIKTGRKASDDAMRRWIWRTEIYNIAFPFIKKGAHTVVSEVFGAHEMDVIKELTKHIKRGEAKNSKTFI